MSAGCAARVHTELRPQLAPPRVAVAALWEPRLLYEHTPAELAARTHLALDALWPAAGVWLVAPEEFRALDPRAEPLLRTDLVALCEREGWPVDQLVTLAPSLEVRLASSGSRMETERGAVAGRAGSVQSLVVATVEAAHLTSGATFAEWRVVLEEDPFAPAPEHDPRPVLRQALDEALAAAAAWLQTRAAEPLPAALGAWRANGAAVAQAAPAIDPLALDGPIAAQARLALLDPTADLAQASAALRSPPAVCLTAPPLAPTPALAGWTAGDCASGPDLRHPASLLRRLHAPRPRPPVRGAAP